MTHRFNKCSYLKLYNNWSRKFSFNTFFENISSTVDYKIQKSMCYIIYNQYIILNDYTSVIVFKNFIALHVKTLAFSWFEDRSHMPFIFITPNNWCFWYLLELFLCIYIEKVNNMCFVINNFWFVIFFHPFLFNKKINF